MSTKNGYIKIIYSSILILLLLLIDQVSKYLAVLYLKGRSGIDIIPNIFRLQYLENRGAAFGMMQEQFTFFYIITPIIIITVLYMLLKLPNNKRYNYLWYCGILLNAGALGNLIDRIRLNYVIDFFYFEYIDFPIFNIADIYVCIATAVFIFLLLFYYKEDEFEAYEK